MQIKALEKRDFESALHAKDIPISFHILSWDYLIHLAICGQIIELGEPDFYSCSAPTKILKIHSLEFIRSGAWVKCNSGLRR